jgi:hypothetical protein
MQNEKRWFIIIKRWCFLKILTSPETSGLSKGEGAKTS